MARQGQVPAGVTLLLIKSLVSSWGSILMSSQRPHLQYNFLVHLRIKFPPRVHFHTFEKHSKTTAAFDPQPVRCLKAAYEIQRGTH